MFPIRHKPFLIRKMRRTILLQQNCLVEVWTTPYMNPYGLSYDQENYYFTYNGNVVRFFNDPIAGASFTNFFSGTVDIEADRDEENNLVGIKECSKENYDRHTQKHNNFNPTDTSLSTVQKGESTPQLWLKDYADYGITYNEQSGGWYYNNQRIKDIIGQ